MSRPNGASQVRGNNFDRSNIGNPGVATPRPNIGGVANAKPNGGFERPSVGSGNVANKIGDKPNLPGRADGPKIGGDRPSLPGAADRPNMAARPGAGGASSSQLNDFLGLGDRQPAGNNKIDLPNDRLPNVGNGDRPNINKNDLTKLGDRKDSSTNINVGNVNVGNSSSIRRTRKLGWTTITRPATKCE